MKLKTTPDDVFYYLAVGFSTLVIIAWAVAIVGNILTSSI
jgi:hypothetical protein